MSDGLEEEVFDVDAVLDNVGADEYNPTEKTSSHFLHARQVIQELKNLASFPLVGPPELDNRQRWAHRISLISIVRSPSPPLQ